jgi:hypothetical protein
MTTSKCKQEKYKTSEGKHNKYHIEHNSITSGKDTKKSGHPIANIPAPYANSPHISDSDQPKPKYHMKTI